ncbi:MAG: hypothetical protein II517_00995, partial [Ruminococcus sp.]|nr:hypothetical protein [Ruminococcus sp.]
MLKKLYRIILSVFVAVLLTTAVSLSAGAESFLEPPTQQSQLEEPTQPDPTWPDPFWTEPVFTEPPTAAPEPVWTVAPEEYYEEEETESPREEYAQLLDEAEEP